MRQIEVLFSNMSLVFLKWFSFNNLFSFLPSLFNSFFLQVSIKIICLITILKIIINNKKKGNEKLTCSWELCEVSQCKSESNKGMPPNCFISCRASGCSLSFTKHQTTSHCSSVSELWNWLKADSNEQLNKIIRKTGKLKINF